MAEDFSECRGLAAQHPDKLAELQQLWWAEAARNQVLPLNNEPGRYADVRFVRARYVYHPPISPIPEAMAPNLRRRPYRILAALDAGRPGPLDGVIVCHGGHTEGYVFFVKDRRLLPNGRPGPCSETTILKVGVRPAETRPDGQG